MIIENQVRKRDTLRKLEKLEIRFEDAMVSTQHPIIRAGHMIDILWYLAKLGPNLKEYGLSFGRYGDRRLSMSNIESGSCYDRLSIDWFDTLFQQVFV